MYKFNVGSRIKNYRELKKISKSELARRIDVSPAYVTMLENGKKENPSLEILIKISSVLGVSLPILLWDETKFIIDLLSYFQNAYQNNTNHFPKEHEIINILINNSIISDEKAPIILNNYSNFSSEEIENLISFMKKLDINVYTQFTENEEIKKIRLLGEQIFNLRKNNNLSLKELSTKCNMTEFYLKKLEKGFTTYPPDEFLDKISDALGINKDTLFFNGKNKHIRKSPKIGVPPSLINNRSIQNSLLYNFILSYLVSRYYTNSIDNVLNKLNLDNIEQLAVQILNYTGSYLLSTVNTSLNNLCENPKDLSFNKEALNTQIEIYNEYLPYDVKTMTYAYTENDEIKPFK